MIARMSASEPERDVASALVTSLIAGAEPVDEGHFTLDPAVALAKLRANQLVDPRDYLLLLVEAAYLVGGEGGIRITLGRTTSAEFSGLALAPGALSSLFSAALTGSRSADTATRVLQLLGLAANAALGLAPRSLTLISGDAEGRASRIVIAPSGEVEVSPPGEARVSPSTIYFVCHGKRAWRANAATLERLRERCHHASLPVWVEGQRVSFGPTAMLSEPPSATTRVPVIVEGRSIGVVGRMVVSRAAPQLILVNRGVAIVERVDAPLGVQAVVEVDLPLDLSRSKLLESAELATIRERVQTQVAALVAASAPAPEPEPEPTPQRPSHPHARAWTFAAVVLVIALLNYGRQLWRSTSEPARKPKPARELTILPPTHAQRVLACIDERDLAACRVMVDDARRSAVQGDSEGLGVALVHACLAGIRNVCEEAADYVRDGHYPTTYPMRTDYGPIPVVTDAQLRACKTTPTFPPTSCTEP
jgi:hypothetical protein